MRTATSAARRIDASDDDGQASSPLDQVIGEAERALFSRQQRDGHWVFELEADASITSEHILLQHFLDEIDEGLVEGHANYLRRRQEGHGGWALYFDGPLDVSSSVKAYFALKCAGDGADDPHMVRARAAILAAGGAETVNVFTRVQLALFGELPWTAIPVMPVEIMNLPGWFPFHLDKVSYWSRTVIVPLLILMALKPKARNPRGISIRELFHKPGSVAPIRSATPSGKVLGYVFRRIDDVLRLLEPKFPKAPREKALQRAVDFVLERLNGEDGLGAIYPAMANTIMAFTALGFDPADPSLLTAKKSVRKLVVRHPHESYTQPCLSPVWDTSLAAHALLEAKGRGNDGRVGEALDWLVARQVLTKGDWAKRRPDAEPGGWPFQYANDHYPDVDDTAVVGMAIDRGGNPVHREAVRRAAEWVIGMQAKDGGWGAFEADNDHDYLNAIPFADHGALLDPSTADVTARCVGFLAQIGHPADGPVLSRAIDYLRREQEEDGSWFGRWGTNYIYGTWSVLSGLNGAGLPPDSPEMTRGAEYLISRQRPDGGWGEDGASYWADRKDEVTTSTPSQTAWALLGLMAAGRAKHGSVRRGVDYLLRQPRPDGLWEEKHFTAVGFPKVFYLRYHGYRAYFPLFALARYRALQSANAVTTGYGL